MRQQVVEEGRLAAVSRLIAVHNLRVFETWLAEQARAAQVPRLSWVSARVAVVAEGQAPVVVVLVGLCRRAWWALGALHLLAWWRVRQALGPVQKGHLVRVRVLL